MDTQDESTGEESRSTADRPKANSPKRLSLTRIVLFLLLALMVGALVLDQRARRESQAAFEVVTKALGDDKKMKSVPRDEVHRLLGREPDDDGEPDDAYEKYSWQGVPRKQTVFVVYWSAKEPTLKDVSLNEAPR
jgi:hypothetical protein